MSQPARPQAKPPGARLARAPGVELFASGTRGGLPFPPADVDELAENARRYGHLIRPPLKIGHGERQLIAAGLLTPQERASEATGIPRFGGVDWRTVRAEWRPCPACGGSGRDDGERCPECQGRGRLRYLIGDFHQVKPSLANLINGRHFDRVSVEIYPRDRPPPDMKPGKLHLRAVAIEGGDLPVVKSLGEIPELVPDEGPAPPVSLRFSESRTLPDGVLLCFSEVRRMYDKAKCYAEIGGKVPENLLDEMPDHHVQAIADGLKAAEGMPDYPDDAEPPEAPQGQAPAYSERARRFKKYAEKAYKKYAEPGGGPDQQVNAMTPQPDSFSEGRIAQFIHQALDARLGPVKGTLADLERETVHKFCEGLVKEGKLDPSELDASSGLPTLVDDLLRLDGGAKVHKFSEGGKTVALSQREVSMRRLANREPARHGDRAKAGPYNAPPEDAEIAKIRQDFYAFSEHFPAGQTAEGLVEGFKAARKTNPRMSAREFMGPLDR